MIASKKALERLENNVNLLEQQVNDKHREISTTLQDWQDYAEDLEQEIEQVRAIAEDKQRLLAVEDDLNQLQRQLEQLDDQDSEQVEELQDTVEQLQRDICRVDEQVEDAASSLSDLENRVNNICDRLYERIGSVEEELLDRITALEERMDQERSWEEDALRRMNEVERQNRRLVEYYMLDTNAETVHLHELDVSFIDPEESGLPVIIHKEQDPAELEPQEEPADSEDVEQGREDEAAEGDDPFDVDVDIDELVE